MQARRLRYMSAQSAGGACPGAVNMHDREVMLP